MGLLIAAAFFTGSALAQNAPTAVSGSPEADYRRGVELYQAGRYEDALTHLRGFVISNYNSPLLPDAYLTLARIFHDQNQCGEAALYLERVPVAKRGPEARLIEGSCRLARGDAAEAREILSALPEGKLDSADRVLLYGRMGEAHARLEQPLRALLFYRRALEQAQLPQRWFEEVHRLLQGASEPILEEAAFMFRGSGIAQDAKLQLAQRAFERGERHRARQLAEHVLDDPTLFPYRGEASALLDRLTGGAWLQRDVLGVILPLSGRYATFGELVQRGMQLALDLHNRSNSPITFLFRDGAADPDRTARAVSTLANEDRVIAIAGPLTGAAAQSAAQQAVQNRVPLLTLSQHEGLPATGDVVFRNSLTNRMQAQALARYGVETRGWRTFGVLYPESRLGQEMLSRFSEEAVQHGGRVVAMQSYPEKATDFRRQIKRLMGKDPDAPEADAKEKRRSPPPFDALLIPDYADKVALIAPQLVFYGLEGVNLLGINGWNSPDLLRQAGRFVEGAVFVDGFFLESPSPAVREFVARYRQAYGDDPTILEAQAFDTAGILLYLLSRPDVQNRRELRQALASLRNYPGVTGTTSFNRRGEAEKELFLIRIEKGGLQQVHP